MPIRIRRIPKTSPTARDLVSALSATVPSRLLNLENSVWRGKPKDLLINWGSSEPIASHIRAHVLNKPTAVALAADKLKTFEILSQIDGVNIPYYIDPVQHLGSLTSALTELITTYDIDTLLIRTTTTGSGGEGIHVLPNIKVSAADFADCDPEYIEYEEYMGYLCYLIYHDETWAPIFAQAKLITGYFKAPDEYRVHVMFGQPIFAQRKSLRTDELRPETPNFIIRNHTNGFIFQQNNVSIPQDALNQSVKAVQALGLDFGAVDIRVNSNGRPCILEVNTAPGLSGTTLETYVNAFYIFHEALQEQ